METSSLLEELLELSMKKEIPYSATQLKKMKEDRLAEIMEKYKERELDKMNEDLVDLIFDRYESALKKVSLIKKDSNLSEKLKDRKLLRKDLKNVVASVSGLLPFVGIFEGLFVTAAEVFDNMKDQNKENESVTSETKEGEKSDQTFTEQPSCEE